MNTDNQKPDGTMLAKDDLGSSFVPWEEPELKPGEKKLVKFYRYEKRRLEKEIQKLEEDLTVLKMAHKNALEFEAADTANRKNIEAEIQNLQTQIENLQAELNTKQERKEKIKKVIKLQLNNHPELKERADITEQQQPEKAKPVEQKSLFKKFFRQILPAVMLVLFCLFDGVNMFMNLNNYNYDTVRHGFISAIIFIAVLFSSFGVKMKNTLVFWIAFIVFLSVANVPQFLGRNPKFGLSNLTSSPEHIIIFILSFGGSILITLLNLSLKEKDKQPSVTGNAPTAPPSDIETAAGKTLNRLYYELDEATNHIATIEHKIIERQNELQEKIETLEQETATKTTEKVEAVQSLAAKQNHVTDQIEKLKTKIEELPEECITSIEQYRQEVSILQLINDYPQAIKYQDVKSITI